MKTAHPKTQLGVGKLVKFIICLLILAFVGTSARADMESTTVLPQGVTDPVLLFGILSGLSDKFNADGEVQGVTDRFHIQLIGQTLANLSPQLQQLIQTLNASSNQNLGNQLSVGTMDFKSNPQVTYVAPQLDYGLSQNFSIGIGVPLIHYHNDVSIVGSGVNNAAAISATVGPISQAATEAFNTLANLNIPSTVQQVLASKGYQPIRTIDQTNFGDVIVSGVYKYYSGDSWKLALRPFIQLPTGTKPDPDDLESFATGGQPAVGLYSIHDYTLAKDITLTSSVGYQANIPDNLVMRVPLGPTDILPGPDRQRARVQGIQGYRDAVVRAVITSCRGQWVRS